MKVFYYSPADLGMQEFPSGLMRLAGAEVVSDPAVADAFVLPPILRHVGPDGVARLPHLAGRERRHIFWNLAEDMGIAYPCGPLYLRADAVRGLVDRCPSVRAWPWPVDDLYAPDIPFDFDVAFQGWASTHLTNEVVDSVRRSGLRAHLVMHKFFYGYHYHDPAYAHLRASFIDTLRRSRLSLVPRSIPAGVIRYRFYEAMSAGRVPVHFNDGRVLPWADRIDYDRCSLHIAERDAGNAGRIIANWLQGHDDEHIRAMGDYGRAMWLRWLDPRHWDERFTEVVGEWLS